MMKLNKSTIFIILIILVVIGAIVSKRIYESKKKESIDTLNNKVTPSTYFEVKQESFTNFNRHFEVHDLNAIFIEYHYKNIKHALVVRRDSLTSIISIANPNIVNVFNKDRIDSLSFALLNLVDKQYNKLPFSEKKKLFLLKKYGGIIVNVHSYNDDVLYLNINSSNYKQPVYNDIMLIFSELISKINGSEIKIDNLITFENLIHDEKVDKNLSNH